MDYKEALDFLLARLPMYQRDGASAYRPRLSNTFRLCQALGDPQNKFVTIHVAGTNGKGSVSAMIASILAAAGYRTGLYTSPHLKSFTERIRVNGKTIPEDRVADFVRSQKSLIESLDPSFFEVTVAMAFDHFAKERIDVAVVEVGLGGRLDSTNIIDPELAVVTNVSLDHQDLLGKTTEAIAWEKAGIMKPGIPAVIGEAAAKVRSVFLRQARIAGGPVFMSEDFLKVNVLNQSMDAQLVDVRYQNQSLFGPVSCPLTGNYQIENIRTVAAAVLVMRNLGLRIIDAAVKEGIRGVRELSGLRGRWDILNREPLVIADVAHNEDGLKKVMAQLDTLKNKKRHMVIGMVQDKDRSALLEQLPQNATYYFVKPNINRGLDANVLAQEAKAAGLKGKVYPTVKEGYFAALENAKKEDLVYVGGSSFVVAEIL